MAEMGDRFTVRVSLVPALATALYVFLTVFVPVLVAVAGLSRPGRCRVGCKRCSAIPTATAS